MLLLSNRGLDENYSVLVLENLVIDPTIEGDESQYDYVWYAFPGTVTSSAPNDTLGVSKKLDCTISMEPGTYQLVFKVTDKSNGTSAFYKFEVSGRPVSSVKVIIFSNMRMDIRMLILSS